MIILCSTELTSNKVLIKRLISIEKIKNFAFSVFETTDYSDDFLEFPDRFVVINPVKSSELSNLKNSDII